MGNIPDKLVLASEQLAQEGGDNVSIEDYVFGALNIEKSFLSEEDQKIIYKNYIYLMCRVKKDLAEIEERLNIYNTMYKAFENKKGDDIEFKRRKLNHFLRLNNTAREEICSFMANGVEDFLSGRICDLLKRECERGGKMDFLSGTRYKYAWFQDYYSIDFPYSIVVKTEQYLKDKYCFEEKIEEEKRLLMLYDDDPNQFWEKMKQYVDEDDIIKKICDRVADDYYLVKRQEIFATLQDLFSRKQYQSFVALGVIQVEGLFDDYCRIRYGDKDNMGTLVEKARRILDTNDYLFLRMYPYFAFDVPLLRNEVAHMGMLKTRDAEEIAYKLLLDLNTLSQMVKSESCEKLIIAKMLYEKLISEITVVSDATDEFFDGLLYELCMLDTIASNHFWAIIKNPEAYRDELDFYKADNLPSDKIDIRGIVETISDLIKSEDFWKAMNRLLSNFAKETIQWVDAIEFARKMKNQYIKILQGAAKDECIKVAKTLKEL